MTHYFGDVIVKLLKGHCCSMRLLRYQGLCKKEDLESIDVVGRR